MKLTRARRVTLQSVFFITQRIQSFCSVQASALKGDGFLGRRSIIYHTELYEH